MNQYLVKLTGYNCNRPHLCNSTIYLARIVLCIDISTDQIHCRPPCVLFVSYMYYTILIFCIIYMFPWNPFIRCLVYVVKYTINICYKLQWAFLCLPHFHGTINHFRKKNRTNGSLASWFSKHILKHILKQKPLIESHRKGSQSDRISARAKK